MFDSTIVLSSPGTQLAVNSSHFTLRGGGKQIGRIPVTMMGSVIVHPGVEITMNALDRLGILGIPVTFLDTVGRVRSRLCSPLKHDASARLEQAKVYFDKEARLFFAKKLIDAKISNCHTVLKRHGSNYPNADLRHACKELKKYRSKAVQSRDFDELMGWEGIASKAYFSVFSQMIRAPWAKFQLRSRRPPLDPVNSVLSYSYAVLTHEIQSLLESAGLDPYIGYLHSTQARRPSLALDLLEPFRAPLADRMTLRLINLGVLREEHFEQRQAQPGIFINKTGRLAILKECVPWSNACDDFFGDQQPSPRGIIRKSIDNLASKARLGRFIDFEAFYLDSSEQMPCQDLEQ